MALIIKPSQLEESAKLGAQFRHCIHEDLKSVFIFRKLRKRSSKL